MKLAGVELRRIAHAAGRAVPHLVRDRDRPRRPARPRRHATTPRAGASAWPWREPLYSAEYVDGAARRDPATSCCPALFALPDVTAADGVAATCAPIKGHPMAKAALETAVLDAELRAAGVVARRAPRRGPRPRAVRACRSGSWTRSRELLDAVAGYLDEGYVRIKLKIEPGWDVEPVRAVRERFGDDLLLQVDANTAYTLADARHLAELDPFGLLLIEQPLPEDDMLGHAELAAALSTPICLDESIISAERRGRRDRARRLLDRQHQARPGRRLPRGRAGSTTCARRTACRCGAAGCSRPASAGPPTSPSPRCPASRCPATPRRPTATSPRTITEPFVLEDGRCACRPAPGIGVEPIPEVLEALTTSVEMVTRRVTPLRARSPAMLEALGELVACRVAVVGPRRAPALRRRGRRTSRERVGGDEPVRGGARRSRAPALGGRGTPRVLLLGHFDTVWPAGSLAARPFAVATASPPARAAST